MHIIVPIKQVPETSNVKMDPVSGTMLRTGVETVVNPLDLYALESAFRLKEQHGGVGTITVITMGPPQAVKVLKEALAMGCDQAYLISDKAFAGSDTWATSYVLSRAIMELGAYDLIIAGERATDGDTGQVGPGIAAWLDIPAVTYAAAIESTDAGFVSCSRMVEEGYQQVAVQLPAVITVVKEIGAVRLPTLRGKIRSRSAEIPLIDAGKLSAHKPLWGLSKSPTRVVKIEQTTVKREGKTVVVDEHTPAEAAADSFMEFLAEKHIILGDRHA